MGLLKRQRYGAFPRGISETPLAATVITANGNTGVLPNRYGNADGCRAMLAVTTITGTTPTLDVVIEDSPDGVNWFGIGKFTQLVTGSANTFQVINLLREQGQTVLSGFSALWFDQWRIRWTIGGTATPTFNGVSVVWLVR